MRPVRYLLASFVFAMLVWLAPAAVCPAADLNLIPWPKTVQVEPGDLVLTRDSRIVAQDAALLPLAKVLASEFLLVAGIAPSDEPAYSRIELPEGALGPGFAVPVTTSDGRDTTLAFWPFANVGCWYRPGEQKPDRNSAAYRYAAWLLAKDSSEFFKQEKP